MLFGILTITFGIILMALIMIICMYPQLITNFIKLIYKNFMRLTGHPVTDKVTPKVKKNSPEELLKTRIESLLPAQILAFKINPKWGAKFITVKLNMNSPQLNKKYLISLSDSLNPLDDRMEILYDSEDTLFIANSIISREGVLFVPDEIKSKSEKEANASADKVKKLAEIRG
jgi:hypothetical protein